MLWSKIDGKPNYSVSENGDVRNDRTGRILKPHKGTAGYYQIMLGRKTVPLYVHRLVASAFIPNPNELPQVDHINGNKLDNRNNHPFPGLVNGTHFALAHNGVLHNDLTRGTCYSPCHRSRLGPGRSGHSATLLRLHGFQYQGQAHQFGVHRPDCGQAPIAAESRRRGAALNAVKQPLPISGSGCFHGRKPCFSDPYRI